MPQEPRYRVIVATDIVQFGSYGRTDRIRGELRDELHRMLLAALAGAEVKQAQTYRNDLGDGFLFLVDPSIPKTRLLDPLIAKLAAELADHNARSSAAARMQVRVVVHAGDVLPDDHGYSGTALNVAFRLLDAEELRARLAKAPWSPIALIVSETIWSSIVAQGFEGVDPATYEEVRIAAKETVARAWIHLPGGTDMPLLGGAAGPAELPPDIADFVGREGELAALRAQLWPAGSQAPRTVIISAIDGKPGVGKSALAIRIAHEIRDRYRDAQLYANLRGGEGQALAPIQVLNQFLRALGLPGEEIPTELDQASARFRSHLSGKRALIVLDNAADITQVRPLLPGGSACAVVVTSRQQLATLGGAIPLTLRLLDEQESLDLIAALVGADRVEAEQDAAAMVAKLCGYLPLALRIAGAKLRARPGWTVKDLAERLSDERRRLELLKMHDLDVRASFSLSYDGLEPAAARTFRLLGLLTGPDFTVDVAAALAGLPLADAETVLEGLTDAQLLETATLGRYRFHDLLRLFARERADKQEPEAARRAAVSRVLDYLLVSASRADALLEPTGHPPPPGIGRDLTSARQALVWLTMERPNLIAAVEQACAMRFVEPAWQLAARLVSFLDVRGYWDDWQELHHTVLRVVRETGDLQGEAVIRRNLGRLRRRQRRWGEAVAEYERCLPLFERLGDDQGLGLTLLNLGDVERGRCRWAEAATRLREALEILRRSGYRRGEAIALRSLGAVHRIMRRYEEAADSTEEAVRIFTALGDVRWEAATLLSLGHIHLDRRGSDQQRLEELERWFEDCLATFRGIGDRRWEALTLRTLGVVAQLRGRPETALELLGQARMLLAELGDRHWEAVTLHNVGDVHLDRCEWGVAIGCFTRSLPMLEEASDELWVGRTQLRLGICYAATGRPNDAKLAWRRALEVFERQNAPEVEETRAHLAGPVGRASKRMAAPRPSSYPGPSRLPS